MYNNAICVSLDVCGYCLLIYKQSVVTPSHLNVAICHIVRLWPKGSGLTLTSPATDVSLELTTIVTVIGS